MKYLSNAFNLSILNEDNTDYSMKIKSISTGEVMRRLSDFDGYESIINDESSANILSKTLDINILSRNEMKDFTPYDLLIVADTKQLKEDSLILERPMKFMTIELSTTWKVDYYSKDRELLQEVTLGNLSYSEAKKEAFLAGVRIPYDIYDIYTL